MILASPAGIFRGARRGARKKYELPYIKMPAGEAKLIFDMDQILYGHSSHTGFGNADTVVILPVGTVNATIKKRGVNLNFLGR